MDTMLGYIAHELWPLSIYFVVGLGFAIVYGLPRRMSLLKSHAKVTYVVGGFLLQS